MKGRGQVALEFAFMVMLAFIFLAVVLIITAAYLEQAQDEKVLATLQQEGRALQEELLLAASVPDGYQRNLTLPAQLNGYDYTISNTEQTLTLTIEGSVLNENIPPVTGSFTKGANTIRKRNGELFITQ